jgi:hypothetical protein
VNFVIWSIEVKATIGIPGSRTAPNIHIPERCAAVSMMRDAVGIRLAFKPVDQLKLGDNAPPTPTPANGPRPGAHYRQRSINPTPVRDPALWGRCDAREVPITSGRLGGPVSAVWVS